MTKKQYFIFLWALSSMVSILSIVQYGFNCMGYTGLQCLLVSPIWSIAVHGCALFFGIYFAQKIGARLLLLDGNYNFIRDILKPAVFVGVIFTGAALVINTWIPIASINPFSNISSADFFSRLLSWIRSDLLILLFCISGLAFIIKKLAKDVSISIIMPISAGLVMLIPPLFYYFVRSNPISSVVSVDFLYVVVTYVLLSTLLLRKGLETALLCHVVIVAILYMIVPTIITFASA